jgi:sugar/nucleoside kinase (ribokinase family)
MLAVMPSLPRRRVAPTGSSVPRVVVVGDLMLDVVLAPARPLEGGTDVPGTVALRQGGSAANTARWLARLGASTTLVAAVGRDVVGRALVEELRGEGVTMRVARIAGARTGRVGVLVEPGGDRSFVADRGAADRLPPEHLDAAWFRGATALHLPVYSLLAEPLSAAARGAIELARAAGSSISLDLASSGPLTAGGRRAAVQLVRGIGPDLVFATEAEAHAMLGSQPIERLLSVASVAVVKRGAKGATVLARDEDRRLRFEVATGHLAATDTTGAGDAFDAGFLVAWLQQRARGGSMAASLQRAALAGHRAAARQLVAGRPELTLG